MSLTYTKTFGRAFVSGIQGAITWTGLGTHTVAEPASLESTHDWTVGSTLKSPTTGNTIGALINDEKIEMDIEFIPSSDGTTGQNTIANAAGALAAPAPFALVTVTGNEDSALNVTYNYIGGWKVSRTAAGETKVHLRIRRFLAAESTPEILASSTTA